MTVLVLCPPTSGIVGESLRGSNSPPPHRKARVREQDVDIDQTDDPVAATTDAEIIRMVLAGEQSAYAGLVRRYEGIAYRTAVVVAGSNDADDAVQEAFIRAYNYLD